MPEASYIDKILATFDMEKSKRETLQFIHKIYLSKEESSKTSEVKYLMNKKKICFSS